MKNKIFLLIGALFFSIATYCMYLYNKPHQEVLKIEPELYTTAHGLIEKNGKTPEMLLALLDEVIEVSGEITMVEKGDENIIVILDNGIKCELEKQQYGQITEGEKVKIKGIYSGVDELFNEISFKRCYLIN